MKPRPVLFAAVAAALLAATVGSASAQELLTCSARNVGQQVCQAEGVCRCAYSAGGTMLRDPPGYRWDCDILYGKCAPGAAMPALGRGVVAGPAPTGARAGKDEVRATQQALARAGFNPGPIDGTMGPRTRAAIRDFQRLSGLKVTGTITPELTQSLQVAAPRN